MSSYWASTPDSLGFNSVGLNNGYLSAIDAPSGLTNVALQVFFDYVPTVTQGQTLDASSTIADADGVTPAAAALAAVTVHGALRLLALGETASTASMHTR